MEGRRSRGGRGEAEKQEARRDELREMGGRQGERSGNSTKGEKGQEVENGGRKERENPRNQQVVMKFHKKEGNKGKK